MDNQYSDIEDFAQLQEGAHSMLHASRNQMRKACARIRALIGELKAAYKRIAELEEHNRQLEAQIAMMQSAQSVTNTYNVDGDLIQHQHIGA